MITNPHFSQHRVSRDSLSTQLSNYALNHNLHQPFEFYVFSRNGLMMGLYLQTDIDRKTIYVQWKQNDLKKCSNILDVSHTSQQIVHFSFVLFPIPLLQCKKDKKSCKILFQGNLVNYTSYLAACFATSYNCYKKAKFVERFCKKW